MAGQNIVFALGIILLAAVLLDIGLVRLGRTLWQADEAAPQVRVLGVYSPVLTWLRYRRLPTLNWREGLRRLATVRWGTLVEVAWIGLWGLWVGRAYLNSNTNLWPYGSDFPRNSQMFYVWRHLWNCGACVLWYGAINGGAPAFADIFAPVLNPLFIFATVGRDAITASKLMLIGSLIIAGMAQWWLAKVMRLGTAARWWVATLAVVGGHLSSRMEGGWIVVLMSAATSSLIFAPGLQLALTGSRRAAVLFGLTLALAFMSGHGYMQLGIAFGVLPAFGVFLLDGNLRLRPVWKGLVTAAILAILFSAVFWVPLAHFWPYIAKEADPGFGGSQPVGYALLNLVIPDRLFFTTPDVLQKISWPALYMNYVGWIPVLFMFCAFRLAPRRSLRTLAFFLIATGLVYLTASAQIFKHIDSYLTFLSGARNLSLIVPLAIPLILAMSAWGLDELLRLNWPKVVLTLPSGTSLGVSAAWLLALPMFLSLKSAHDFSRDWLITRPVEDISPIVQELKTETTQWVAVPPGDFPFLLKALDGDLKIILHDTFTAWNWGGRESPLPYFSATHDPVDPNTPGFWRVMDGLSVFQYPANQYAFVDTGSQQFPCRASAVGGNVDVDCFTDQPGTLIVRESRWSGWHAKRDGRSIALGGGQWLNVAAPAGEHHFEFRYRPWDVTLGLILVGVGMAAAIWLWRQPPAALQEGSG